MLFIKIKLLTFKYCVANYVNRIKSVIFRRMPFFLWTSCGAEQPVHCHLYVAYLDQLRIILNVLRGCFVEKAITLNMIPLSNA